MYLRNVFRLPVGSKQNFLLNSYIKNIIIVKRNNSERCLICVTKGRCAFNQNQICFPI